MQNDKVGYIYILTNESFHRTNWVKIGYTTNIKKRIKDLSNTSVPLPYELYASYEIPASEEMEKSDKYLHALIESLNPSLRLVPNREFFEMEPEDSYMLLNSLAKIHGRDDKLVDGEGRLNYLKTLKADSDNEEKKSPTKLPKMDWCMEQGLISIGDLVFIRGYEDVVAEVISSSKVRYKDEEMSFNAFGCTVTGWKAIQVYVFLTIVGESETLQDKRLAKMKELGML
ncbi:MAG TPA: GIY-YIG nuclease family protein [Candidatus Paceibacterota bacterium]|jgi:hypothetical protein|nr:GIY-YIG nuclease family protein [Candidatus Paceibacterota bacterium]